MAQKAVRSEASSTNSLGPERDCRTRTVLSWLLAALGGGQVHRDGSLHLGNARVSPGHSAVEGSEDGGGGRAASGRERGHP